MTTEHFTKDEFEKVLSDAVFPFYEPLYNLGELTYQLPIESNGEWLIYLLVRSSIGRNGVADDSGENSIRVYVRARQLSDSKFPVIDKPFYNIDIRWISRVKGWDVRLVKLLNNITDMIREHNFCPNCNHPGVIYKVMKNGPNKDRLFITCKNVKCNKPMWEWVS